MFDVCEQEALFSTEESQRWREIASSQRTLLAMTLGREGIAYPPGTMSPPSAVSTTHVIYQPIAASMTRAIYQAGKKYLNEPSG